MASWPLTISEHRGVGPTHFDVLVGAGPRCRTWRFERGPRGWVGRPIQLHRRRYLTWSGPISGGRGTVQVRGRFRVTGVVHRHSVWLLLRPNPFALLGLGGAKGVYLQQRSQRVVQIRTAMMIAPV